MVALVGLEVTAVQWTGDGERERNMAVVVTAVREGGMDSSWEVWRAAEREARTAGGAEFIGRGSKQDASWRSTSGE